MAGKKTVKEEILDDDILGKENDSADFDSEELSGEIIRPRGVVDSSEMQNTKPSHERDGVTIVRDSAVASQKTVFNDGTVNIPSRGIPEGNLVKVRLKNYARFRHGKDFYELYPGAVYEVPEDVKDSLKKAGYLEVA